MRKINSILLLSTCLATAGFAQIQPDANGNFTLSAAAMTVTSANGSFDGSRRNGWSSGSGTWSVNAKSNASYKVYANYTSGYASMGIEVNGVSKTCSGTGDWGTYLDVEVGTITLSKGTQTITMTVKNNPINFDHVTLVIQPGTLSFNGLSNNAAWGAVVRSPYISKYYSGDTLRIAAVPQAGYRFTSWSDGVTQQERKLVITADMSLTATFSTGGAILPNGVGSISMPASGAQLDAQGISYDNTAITSWTSGAARWNMQLDCATNFIVKGEMSSENTASGNLNLALIKGTDTTNVQCLYTNMGEGLSVYASRDIATINLQSGDYQIIASRVVERGVENQLNLKTLNLEKQATFSTTLTPAVNRVGYGKVTISAFKTSYNATDVVTVTAVPAEGYQFVSWSGDLVSTNTTENITMSASKKVVANFAPVSDAFRTLSLSANNAAYGSVTSNPTGTSFLLGSKVIITAQPNMGSQFVGWTGDLTSTKLVDTVVVDSNIVATANFEPIHYTITAASSNIARGTVSKSPEKTTYTYGEKVIITATPKDGCTFVNWTDDLTSTKQVDTIVVTGNKTVTANFTAITYTLTLSCSAAQGTVSKTPDKQAYSEGEKVAIVATPLAGFRFVAWGGDFISTKSADVITVNTAMSITATFESTTDVQSSLVSAFKVHPNPFTGNITVVAVDNIIIESLEVLDLQGRRCIQSIKVDAVSIMLGSELNVLPQGSYLVRINTKQGSVSYKVVKK